MKQMKKIFSGIFLAFLLVQFAQGQSFTFETASVPSDWVASNGTLSLSTEHYKDGVQSLCWETSGKSVLNVSFTSFIAGTGNSAFMQIYSPETQNDTLVVEFLYYSTAKKTARFLCNYKGWREFNRAYTEYASTLSSSISSVRITLKPTNGDSRKIYFDQVNFNKTTDAGRIAGTQWLIDRAYFSEGYNSLDLYANQTDIPLSAPTAGELADLNSLKIKLKRTPTAGTSTALTAAKTYVQSLNIVRNPDGSVSGKAIGNTVTDLTITFMTDISTKLEILAAAALNDAPTMVLFQNFLDHLLDQGIAEGCSFEIKSNNYTPSRAIPSALLDILPACNASQKEEVLKLVRWISYYGMMYQPESNYLSNLNSDVVYLFTPHMLGVAINQSNDEKSLRELKAFKRFLERNTEYVPGGGDILKPDGTGFHHATHYNNYMYSYKTWADQMYQLKGTNFRISSSAYERFKKAVLSMYLFCTSGNGDVRYNANALCGRNPFSSGMQIQFSQDLLDKLIQIGGDCMGTAIDSELAAAYNFFYQTTKYPVTARNYDGFYQFNYSPTGIYRKDNWVATMHAPTTKFFGAEIYSTANRFGRYQSHGALEILYNGSLAANGYPTNGTGAGWDWNVIPGTTTVHYTSWQEMMPNKNTTDRFDQFTKTKNFSGALSFGNCGLFATDFDQLETWGGAARYTATNLVFKKSMFAFDKYIFSLGSNISASGTYSTGMITATNLFQHIVSGSGTNFIVNGNVVTKPHTSTISTTSDNWLITPAGTGYFIPKGNDAIEIRYNDQTSPNENGSDYAAPATTVSAAKAFLNHGVKTSSKSYSFVAVPATNTTEMQTISNQLGNGSIFEILAQNSALHALSYKPENIIAYSFFGSVSNLNFGIVKSVTAENLLIDKYDSETGRHRFAICNPNLKPVTDNTYGWIPSTSQTTLTLSGEWAPETVVDGVVFATPVNNQTQITITLKDGAPLYFGARVYGDTTGVNAINLSNNIRISENEGKIQFHFSEDNLEEAHIHIFNSNGQKIMNKIFKTNNNQIEIPFSGWAKGIYICKVTYRNQSKTIKWII